MITRKDIAEIKHIIDDKLYSDIIKGMAGAYVDGSKSIVHQFREPFHMIAENERHKYLKIAQEIPCVKGFDDKTMELSFYKGSAVPGLLSRIAEYDLQDEEYLTGLYERIIENYDIENGFLILVFHGTYDVIGKTSDGNEIDESEEVYDFLLCAICPVNWDKPGLKYDPSGKICAKQLQNIVGKAETGFIWPAFEERSANPEKCIFYCQKPKSPQHEVITGALECIDRMTATENRMKFEKMITKVVLNSYLGEAESERMLQKLNMAFGEIVQSDQYDHQEKESVLTDLALRDLCEKEDINEVLRESLINEFKKFYGSILVSWPKVWWLYDKHAAAVARYNKKKERFRTVMKQAVKVCETSGQQDLAQEIKEMLEEVRDA